MDQSRPPLAASLLAHTKPLDAPAAAHEPSAGSPDWGRSRNPSPILFARGVARMGLTANMPKVVSVPNGAIRDAAGWVATQLAEQPDGLNGCELRLDFGAVEYVESRELGALVVLNRRARDAGGRLTLVDVRPLVAAVLEVTRLDSILDVRRAI